MTSTSELLLEWTRRSPRSQQREIGMSELGSCRRKVGYRLAGQTPTNAGGSVQAAMGGAIHDAIHKILLELGTPGVTAETEVTFAGIKGHYDRVEDDILVDVKTTSSRWLEHIKLHGPEHSHLWQVSCYAAALITQNTPIKRIRIDYLARDTGEEYQWPDDQGTPFRPVHVREALEWLKLVRDTPVEMLPRDYEPESTFCRGCVFFDTCWGGAVSDMDRRSVLYLEDPDLEKWISELWQARLDKKDAADREDRAKGALSAVNPVTPNQRIGAGGWEIAWNSRGALAVKATPAEVQRGSS